MFAGGRLPKAAIKWNNLTPFGNTTMTVLLPAYSQLIAWYCYCLLLMLLMLLCQMFVSVTLAKGCHQF